PERVNFIKKYGKKIFFISFIFYLIALILSFLKNIIVGIVVLIPVIIAIFYSFFRLKKITFIKNILVGFAWAFGNCVLVYSFFNIWNLQSIIFFLIFFLSFTINTIIFDIKDITGDRIQNIITMPVKYGIKNTKLILYGIFILTILITFYSFLLNFNTIIIFPYIIFLGVCINYIRENKKYPWWYFGVAVDGEFLILFLSFIVYTLMVL
ncbi:MAG: UbiA family prenyltransferase, partial [Candidatus Aenigmatarchaeota archaeon]